MVLCFLIKWKLYLCFYILCRLHSYNTGRRPDIISEENHCARCDEKVAHTHAHTHKRTHWHIDFVTRSPAWQSLSNILSRPLILAINVADLTLTLQTHRKNVNPLHDIRVIVRCSYSNNNHHPHCSCHCCCCCCCCVDWLSRRTSWLVRLPGKDVTFQYWTSFKEP